MVRPSVRMRWYDEHAEVHLLHGGAHEVTPGLVDVAELLRLGRSHVAVDHHARLAPLAETHLLHLPRRLPHGPAVALDDSPASSDASF